MGEDDSLKYWHYFPNAETPSKPWREILQTFSEVLKLLPIRHIASVTASNFWVLYFSLKKMLSSFASSCLIAELFKWLVVQLSNSILWAFDLEVHWDWPKYVKNPATRPCEVTCKKWATWIGNCGHESRKHNITDNGEQLTIIYLDYLCHRMLKFLKNTVSPWPASQQWPQPL